MAKGEGGSLWQLICEAPVSTAGGRGVTLFKDLTRELEASATGDRLRPLLEDLKVRSLLSGMFEGSPYLTALAQRDSQRLSAFLTSPPETSYQDLVVALRRQMARASDLAFAKSALRQFKSGVALLTALADLGGVWPVMTVTRVLSETADVAVNEAVRFLFREAVARGEWRADTGEAADAASGYFVLAMGKWGAFELNYSSDIDLIVFFDRDKTKYCGQQDLQSFYVRLTKDLVALLEERTPGGYVFRTDLRLRPDAGATQVALSTAAAHGYYETVGQNWERAAMIKARVAAGDMTAGQEFLDELAPFIWRKYLDYAAIADIHAMKRQIHAHKGLGDVAVLGQNIKLGRGGIREIEFFVQTQQLIAGGRQADLRKRETLAALRALEKRGWVQPVVATELDHAYRYLRRLEHRLQMVGDEQTHDMPGDDDGLLEISRFCGHEDVGLFSRELRQVLETVERHYAGLFEGAPALSGADSNMVFAGATDDPATVEELARLGYSQPSQVLAIVRSWHHGRTQAVRSARARERLTEVQPLLITALADTVDPDAAIAGFDRFLSELPAGVQLFSLLKANPALIRLIANIMGSAPRLARILSERRRLLDAVLDPHAPGDAAVASGLDGVLAREFAQARRQGRSEPLQDILDRARVIGSEQGFLTGLGLLTGSLTAAQAGAAYATIAERLVAALLADVTLELELDHGKVPGAAAVVVALGKLGGREMTASSDLDLILIYDFDDGALQSDGPRPLAAAHYYARLTQRLVTALSAPTAEGKLYDVDMRLRPSGQKGPLATRLSSFAAYQASEAWTWEHMALTRARVIAGSRELGVRTEAAIRDCLIKPRDRTQIARDVHEMRALIAKEKGTDNIWDLKQVRGGLVDLEFIAQHLQLIHAASNPSVLDQNTLAAIGKLEAAGCLDRQTSSALRKSGRLLSDLGQILRLCLDHNFEPQTAPGGLKDLLAKAGGVVSFENLETELISALAVIYQAFERLIV